jgi:PhnB protein
MLEFNTYLHFDGNCAEAMHFYERTLDAKLEMLMTFGQSPTGGQLPPDQAKRVMHARLVIHGQALMAADGMPGQPHHGMNGFSLTLTYATAAEAKRAFEALAVGGTVTTPLQKTFWAEAWGVLIDRFGAPWMVNGGMSNPV